MSSKLRDDFREVMARVATPVSVVTVHDDGQPRGCTVSAFSSLSMEPPMALVSLINGSTVLDAIRRVGRFGLNVLGSNHTELAATFARKQSAAEKFRGVDWELDSDVPKLLGALGWVACEVKQYVDGGDHTVVLGTVTSVARMDGIPLTYHLRAFGTHVSLSS